MCRDKEIERELFNYRDIHTERDIFIYVDRERERERYRMKVREIHIYRDRYGPYKEI